MSHDFQPGDLVRNAYPSPWPFRGTVVSTPPNRADAAALVWVAFPPGHFMPSPLGFHPGDLRLAGTRCIPFEAMTLQQMRDHLQLAHGCGFADVHTRRDAVTCHRERESQRGLFGPERVPHTHRKDPR